MLAESQNDRHEAARRLVDDGLTRSQVARMLNVSPQTIMRWVDPDKAEANRRTSLAYKHARPEQMAAYNRRYHQVTKRPCPGCQELMARTSVLCRDCRHAAAQARRSIVIGCYEDGWPLREIADVLDTNLNSLGAQIAQLHGAGALGHRYRVDANGIRLPNVSDL
jgi:orotate phosphoribosyltransferase-like protein